MAWLNATLADSVAGMTAKANAAIATAQTALAALNSQTAAMQSRLTAMLDAATDNKTMLDKLAESGFYMITLAPEVGSWSARLAGALNEPPNSGFCSGTANLIISADPAVVTNAYAKVKTAMLKPIDDANKFIDQTDFSDFVPDAPVYEDFPPVELPDWDILYPSGQWESAKLGDVFGGAMSGIGTASADLNKGVKELLATANHVGKITSALDKGLTAAQDFMTGLQATGVYSIMLPPGAGGYLDRLQAEAGAPPADSELYSAGFVFIAVAAGAEDLAAKYATINTLMKG